MRGQASVCSLDGGAATVHQYLQAGAIDEMHLALSPVVLGEGEHLFAGLDLPKLGFSVAKTVRIKRGDRHLTDLPALVSTTSPPIKRFAGR